MSFPSHVITQKHRQEVDGAFDPDTHNLHLNVELALNTRDSVHPQHARATKRSKDHHGNPVGHWKIECHITFDVKLVEGFCGKVRLVAGDHMTDVPSTITHSSVVSKDLVCIALTAVASNDLNALACDIQNTCPTADCGEKKTHITAGPGFGSEKGAVMIVKKAL